VTVKPSPALSWPVSYADICVGSAPVFLNAANILVYVNNAWVPVTTTGGTGYFAGTGVFGNYMYPSTPGPHTVIYYYTAPNGCSGSVAVTINVIKCKKIVHIKLFLEGYYLVGSGGGYMNDNGGNGGLLHVLNYSPNFNDVDTVIVSAMEPVPPYGLIESQTGILQLNGSLDLEFSSALTDGQTYYFKVNHRNSIETWSAAPVTITSPVTTYDFTAGQSQAYGGNQSLTFDNMGWAIYSGDISDIVLGVGYQDGIIESQDYGDMENAVYVTLLGYVPEDITGDGIVESSDYGLMENNVYFTRVIMRP
jgi:hypothetical protein